MPQEFALGRSNPVTLPATGDVRLDLPLSPDPTANTGKLRVSVKDANGQPVGEACLELLNNAEVPIAHAVTNPGGEAVFTELATGNYFVEAIKSGFALVGPVGAAVVAPGTTNVQLTLTADPHFPTGVIVGVIRSAAGVPIATARVLLESGQLLLDTHPTNAQGQVAFADLAAGNYSVTATAPGFLPSAAFPVHLPAGGVAQFTVELANDPNAQTGSIAGDIRDPNGNPIGGAAVYLFRDSDDVAIAFTFTNAQGHYLFCHLNPDTYFIKANKELA